CRCEGDRGRRVTRSDLERAHDAGETLDTTQQGEISERQLCGGVNASAAAKEEDEVGGLGGGCFVGSMPHGGFLRSPRIRQINGGHPSPAARRKPGCNAGKGKREYPLPDRHLGQHAIDDMRRGVHHPAAAAGRADRSSLVRKLTRSYPPASQCTRREPCARTSHPETSATCVRAAVAPA